MICFGIAVLVLTAINYCESAPHGFLPYRRQDSTPSGFANDIAKGPTPPIIENAKLRYFSGPLLHQSVIHPIYWGGSAKVAFTSRDTSRNVFDFYSTIVHSRYFDWLSEYSAASNGYIIGRGSVLSPLEAQTASALTGAVNDSQIRSFLLDLAVSGEINPTENTYYPIHLPPDVTVTYNNRRSCRDFCGYHNTIGFINAATGQLTRLYYGVIPDQGGNCTTGCGSGSNPFNRFCVVASHLLIEAVTDPAVGLATAFSSPLGWYDEGNQMEIGDLCRFRRGRIRGANNSLSYVVQRQWSNRCKDCIVGYGPSSRCPGEGDPTPTDTETPKSTETDSDIETPTERIVYVTVTPPCGGITTWSPHTPTGSQMGTESMETTWNPTVSIASSKTSQRMSSTATVLGTEFTAFPSPSTGVTTPTVSILTTPSNTVGPTETESESGTETELETESETETETELETESESDTDTELESESITPTSVTSVTHSPAVISSRATVEGTDFTVFPSSNGITTPTVPVTTRNSNTIGPTETESEYESESESEFGTESESEWETEFESNFATPTSTTVTLLLSPTSPMWSKELTKFCTRTMPTGTESDYEPETELNTELETESELATDIELETEVETSTVSATGSTSNAVTVEGTEFTVIPTPSASNTTPTVPPLTSTSLTSRESASDFETTEIETEIETESGLETELETETETELEAETTTESPISTATINVPSLTRSSLLVSSSLTQSSHMVVSTRSITSQTSTVFFTIETDTETDLETDYESESESETDLETEIEVDTTTFTTSRWSSNAATVEGTEFTAGPTSTATTTSSPISTTKSNNIETSYTQSESESELESETNLETELETESEEALTATSTTRSTVTTASLITAGTSRTPASSTDHSQTILETSTFSPMESESSTEFETEENESESATEFETETESVSELEGETLATSSTVTSTLTTSSGATVTLFTLFPSPSPGVTTAPLASTTSSTASTATSSILVTTQGATTSSELPWCDEDDRSAVFASPN